MSGNSEESDQSSRRHRSWIVPTALAAASTLLAAGLGGCAESNGDISSLYPSGADTASPAVVKAKVKPTAKPSALASASLTPDATRSNETPTPEATPPPTIVIDPGHSGTKNIVSSTAQINGKTYTFKDYDYPNYPEIFETFAVSACVGKVLTADGYKVILTKKEALSTVTLAKRAEIANDAHADLAISVHNDHGHGPAFEGVYDQQYMTADGKKKDEYLYREAQIGGKAVKLRFDNPSVAEASHQAAEAIAAARAKAQDHDVPFIMADLDQRTSLAGGDIWWVQLLSRVPWVYNEMGALTDHNVSNPMTLKAENAYATGLIEGVRAAQPITDAPDQSLHIHQLSGCLEAQQADFPANYRSR